MQDKHLILLAINLAAILWVYKLPIVSYMKRFWFNYRRIPLNEQLRRNIKPFDCETCLTGWASLIYLFSTGYLSTDWQLIPINMYLCMIFTRIIK